MWKDRRRAGHNMHKPTSEAAIDRRDKTIRDMIEELVKGTQELKQTYALGDDLDRNQ
jgi:hypothetical protein